VDGRERKVVYRARKLFEAPNRSRDGKYILFNSRGRIYTLPLSGGEPHTASQTLAAGLPAVGPRAQGEPRVLYTGSATHCNNDHGLSPEGRRLAISNSPQDKSLIY
jgi:Tol biopolymer transport system component